MYAFVLGGSVHKVQAQMSVLTIPTRGARSHITSATEAGVASRLCYLAFFYYAASVLLL